MVIRRKKLVFFYFRSDPDPCCHETGRRIRTRNKGREGDGITGPSSRWMDTRVVKKNQEIGYAVTDLNFCSIFRLRTMETAEQKEMRSTKKTPKLQPRQKYRDKTKYPIKPAGYPDCSVSWRWRSRNRQIPVVQRTRPNYNLDKCTCIKLKIPENRPDILTALPVDDGDRSTKNRPKLQPKQMYM